MAIETFEELDPALLAECCRQAFVGALARDVEGPLDFEPEDTGLWISGSIFFSGTWSGLLRLDLPHELARELCSAWTRVDANFLGKDAVRDAVGELANTVTGVLKPTLKGVWAMSLPRISDREKPKSSKGRKDLVGATLKLEAHPFRVSVWKCPAAFKMIVVPKPDPQSFVGGL